MKNYTKEELKNLVREISVNVSQEYTPSEPTGDQNTDVINIIVGSMIQIQKNCENIIVEVLDKILNN